MSPDPVGWPWLRTPAATRTVQRLWPDDGQLIKENNDRLVQAYIRRMFEETARPTDERKALQP